MVVIALIERFSRRFCQSSLRIGLDLLLRISCFLNRELIGRAARLVLRDLSRLARLLGACLDLLRLLFLGLMIKHLRASSHLIVCGFLGLFFYHRARKSLLLLPIFWYFLIPLFTFFLFFLVLLLSFSPLLLFQLRLTPENFKSIFLIKVQKLPF